MTTIAPGTPLITAHGTTATATAATPNQPAEGFRNVDEAIHWRQAQLWLDPAFDRAQPRAATAVARARDGFELLDLDASLRFARSGTGANGAPISWNETLTGFSALDDRVVAVLDGLGARVSPVAGNGGAVDAAGGAMLAMRAGAPPPVTLDGANAAGNLGEAAGRVGRSLPKGALIGLDVAGAAAAAVGGYLAITRLGDDG